MTKYNQSGTLTISKPQGGDWNNEFSIVIRDDKSRAQFIEIKITAHDLMLALSGRSDVSMQFNARALDKVGKHVIHKTVIVQLPKDVGYNERPKLAKRLAEMEVAGTGWIVSDYFGSKDSYFTNDGQEFARARASAYLTDEDYAIYLQEKA